MNTVITDTHIAELSAPPPLTTRYWYPWRCNRGSVGYAVVADAVLADCRVPRVDDGGGEALLGPVSNPVYS